MDKLTETELAALLRDADQVRDNMHNYSDFRRMELENYTRQLLGDPRFPIPKPALEPAAINR